MPTQQKVAHLFRHHYGQLVASLCKRVGLNQLAAVEEAVQEAMLAALETWPSKGEPDVPAAWLYQVAYRKLLTGFRNQTRQQQLLNKVQLDDTPVSANLLGVNNTTSVQTGEQGDIKIPLANEMQDDTLVLLFVSCDDALPLPSQLVFILKSLCGFSIAEIAQRLFISEANVYKRFQRAKAPLQKAQLDIAKLSQPTLISRLPNVLNILYLLFSEGYLSSHPDLAIRQDLCEEAIYLTQMLRQAEIGQDSQVAALLALMYFHLARMTSRQAQTGALILLAEQDRSQWHQGHVQTAMTYLFHSAQGEQVSRYHLEASIAAEHCLAPSVKDTNWTNIIQAYQRLDAIAPSSLQRLSHAIAISHAHGPEEALAFLAANDLPSWLEDTYYYDAVYADFLYQTQDIQGANRAAKKAIEKAPNPPIKVLLQARFSIYQNRL